MKHNRTILVHGRELILSTYTEQTDYGWFEKVLEITVKERMVRWGLMGHVRYEHMDFDAVVLRSIARFSRTRGRMDRCARYLLPRSGVSGREMFTVIKESLERRPK